MAPLLTPVPPVSAFLLHTCISISAEVSVCFGFSIGFSLRHRFSRHPQFLLPHRPSQVPRWKQVGSHYLLLPVKPVAANTEWKMELDLKLPKAQVQRCATKMLRACIPAVSLESSFWVEIWLFFRAVDRTLNLVIFFLIYMNT